MGAQTVPLNLQWLVHRIGDADFWVADSIWLECAGSLMAYLER